MYAPRQQWVPSPPRGEKKLRPLIDSRVLFVCLTQPPVAKKDPTAVSVAHKLKRTDTKTETHTNGSEVHPNIMNTSAQVN